MLDVILRALRHSSLLFDVAYDYLDSVAARESNALIVALFDDKIVVVRRSVTATRTVVLDDSGKRRMSEIPGEARGRRVPMVILRGGAER